MKYKSYEELFVAYRSGELTDPLIMDNDDCFVVEYGVGDPDDEGEMVFRGDGKCDIGKILNAIGVPWEPC